MRTIVTVGAALIVPYAAPALAKSIGLSGVITSATGSAVAGSAIGSAVSGAVLGGITAEATGGDFRRGALGGAVAGGVSGFGQGMAARGPNYGQMGGPGAGSADAAYRTQTGLPTARGTTLQSQTAPPGTRGVGPQSVDGSASTGVARAEVPTGGGDVAGASGASGGVTDATAAGAEQGRSFTQALREVPGEIAERFSNPEALADLTLRAAGMIAQTYITGQAVPDFDETAPEIRDLDGDERRLLDAQMQDLMDLRNRNEELFRQRLETAQEILGEARYFDPEVFGMDAYADVQRREGLRQRETARDAALSPGRAGLSAEDVRRSQLGGAIGAQTAYTQAADSAQQQRLRTYQAGLSALPDPGQFSTINESSTMAGMINQARTSRRQAEDQIRQDRQRQQEGFGEIFESLSEPFMRS